MAASKCQCALLLTNCFHIRFQRKSFRSPRSDGLPIDKRYQLCLFKPSSLLDLPVPPPLASEAAPDVHEIRLELFSGKQALYDMTPIPSLSASEPGRMSSLLDSCRPNEQTAPWTLVRQPRHRADLRQVRGRQAIETAVDEG
jgi:hypothetical protein